MVQEISGKTTIGQRKKNTTLRVLGWVVVIAFFAVGSSFVGNSLWEDQQARRNDNMPVNAARNDAQTAANNIEAISVLGPNAAGVAVRDLISLRNRLAPTDATMGFEHYCSVHIQSEIYKLVSHYLVNLETQMKDGGDKESTSWLAGLDNPDAAPGQKTSLNRLGNPAIADTLQELRDIAATDCVKANLD